MQMKHVLLGTALALISGSAAQAGTVMPDGWYVSLAAGANWIPDGEVDYTYDNFNYSWNTGFIVSGAIGYDFGEHWRAEFEVAYRHNEGDTYRNLNGRSNGITSARVWELSEMINVLYDIPLGGRWSASVGAGIGGNLVNMGWPGSSDLDDYVLAGQLIAQVAYQLSDRWQVYADYHFMMMDDPDFGGSQLLSMEKRDHSVMIGLRFDLQRDHAETVREEPRPMPHEAPRQFIVFFGFNKSNLTGEAHRVVSEAAAAAKQFGSASISIVGHTDTVGSNSYNMHLSLRRAAAVKAALVEEGIGSRMIETSGRGESELMVETGDGVKEPQNRRATIDLH